MQDNFSLSYTDFIEIQQSIEQPRKIRSFFPKKAQINLCNYRLYKVTIMHALVIISHTVLLKELHKQSKHRIIMTGYLLYFCWTYWTAICWQ